MVIQPINDLVAIAAKKGIKEAILSPGSRCAPLTLAFARHPDIHCRTISDERSAAFVAMGMAQQLEKPVVLVCTSGSAALNYGPAVAEAYYQQIPLLIITADRPKEWIDQWDGQTIRQEEIYGKHVKGSFNFPDEFSNEDKVWHAHRITNEAINLANSYPAGPVHINIPLREPFYPKREEMLDFKKDLPCFETVKGNSTLSADDELKLGESLKKFKKIMVVPGQQKPNRAIRELLGKLQEDGKAAVVTDAISNLSSSNSITFHDTFIPHIKEDKDFEPDLIISFGKSIISKGLKLFLRASGATHWHISPAGAYSPDTYQGLSKLIQVSPKSFFGFFSKVEPGHSQAFVQKWKREDEKIGKRFMEVLSSARFGEYQAVHLIGEKIPSESRLHLSNSMAVRYFNFLGLKNLPFEIVCNRGTSGIDGSNSTAVGCTFTTKDAVTLITGDMAFFYDRNAFWHNYNMPNLRIIVLNNHAGGIFRLIDGPAAQPELEEFFETKQALSAEHLAKEFGFAYQSASHSYELRAALDSFYNKSMEPKLLEVFSDSKTNAEILQSVKAQLKGA
ncbi:2-succinyl-5-enolpyruvyl-6-hydroxy-3-cyclohexene-1-carboxylic-acid synthase [Litoribacter ruber]|uniref:2-succinyl-5-enolpyruvyl-6-hydroxy-3- cyclohexene-1-carboxylic-acid synthase n=1 Tax=Litoribacter ruber TaxID=702568 RepID=UPI001BDA6B63|nr:2-succinyl-5-enolpyruvyl-6-hydroxy-3-cyclohexene-1-carboxylic-acid synthase [Litoribacter ruber]MBT0812741.1 2-succinyl-5-enolpyruvyl-6-hydroxy-3-cyclohexene-1-carboxylic-acid synthase [Litoribacter ruber]